MPMEHELSDELITHVATSLEAEDSKLTLRIEEKKKCDAVAELISEYLTGNESTRTMDLSYINLSDTGLYHLCKGLQQNEHLTKLDVSMNCIRFKSKIKAKTERMKEVMTTGEQNTLTSTRNLLSKLPQEHSRSFEEVEKRPKTWSPPKAEDNKDRTRVRKHHNSSPVLHGQQLYRSQIIFCLVDEFRAAMEHTNSLTELNLSNNLINHKGFVQLINGLSVNKSIAYLDISSNPLGSRSGKEIGRLLGCNQNLRSLRVADVSLCNSGMEGLVHSLENLQTSVVVLDVCANKLSDDCCDYIETFVGLAPELRDFNLRNNNFKEFNEEFVDKLINTTGLTSLDLSFNDLRENQILSIFRIVATSCIEVLRLEQMQHVDFYQDTILKAFSKAVAENRDLKIVSLFKSLRNKSSALDESMNKVKGQLLLNEDKFIKLRHLDDEEITIDVNEFFLFRHISTVPGQYAFIENLKAVERDFCTMKRNDRSWFKLRLRSALAVVNEEGESLLDVAEKQKKEQKVFRSLLETLKRYDYNFQPVLDKLLSSKDARVVTFAKGHKRKSARDRVQSARNVSSSFNSVKTFSLPSANLFGGSYILDNTPKGILYKSNRTVVSLARDIGDREVLLKILSEDKQAALQRIQKEVDIRDALAKGSPEDYRHAVVGCKKYEQVETDGKSTNEIYLVLKEKGVPLSSVAKEHSVQAFDVRFIKTFARSAAQVLSFVSNKGISHLDFTPDNILLVSEASVKSDHSAAPKRTKKGAINRTESKDIKVRTVSRWKLIDFDASHSKGSSITPSLLNTLSISSAYMAPELGALLFADEAIEENPSVIVNEKLDVWSFGVVLLELLTGESLFDLPLGTDLLFTADAKERLANFVSIPEDKLDKVLHKFDKTVYPGMPAEDINEIKEAAKDLVKSCLAYDPEDRLTFSEILDHKFITSKFSTDRLKKAEHHGQGFFGIKMFPRRRNKTFASTKNHSWSEIDVAGMETDLSDSETRRSESFSGVISQQLQSKQTRRKFIRRGKSRKNP